MRRVRMLKKQAAWEREGGFDRIKIITERHEETLRRLYATFDPEPFHTGLYDAQRPPTPEEFILGMKVEVERLGLELLLSQQLPPQLLPRQSPAQPPRQPCSVFRRTTGTGKVEHGAQQTTVDDFSFADCTKISKQGGDFSF